MKQQDTVSVKLLLLLRNQFKNPRVSESLGLLVIMCLTRDIDEASYHESFTTPCENVRNSWNVLWWFV